MGRRYTTDLFASRIEMIREKLPLAAIGADVIVGFPGESLSDFEVTNSFIEEMPLSYLHVFTFSERPHTIAENLSSKVSYGEKEIRSKKLIALSETKNMEFIKSNIGQVTDVLFERTHTGGLITGFTSNYIRVEYPWQSGLEGKTKQVKLKCISPGGRMRVELID
jgi:threonylcarbamoyladenosine tRNA methylthiotransferase MtaB